MQFRQLCSICLFLCLGLAATAVAQTIDFVPPVNPGTTINITGTTSYVSVFTVDSKDAKCKITEGSKFTKNELTLKSAVPYEFHFYASHPQPLTLAKAVDAGTVLCLVAVGDAHPATPCYSPKPQVLSLPTHVKTNISVDPANPPATLAQTLSLKVKKGDMVSVYAFSDAYKPLSKTVDANGNKLCILADLSGREATLASEVELTATSGDAQSITLNAPLSTGQQLCLEEDAASGPSEYSYFATVQNPPASPLAIYGKPSSDNTTIVINGTSGQNVSVYQFDGSESGDCTAMMKANDGTLLPIAASGANSSSTNSTSLEGSPPYTITLTATPQAGSNLCLEQTDSNGKNPQYSVNSPTVLDANNPYPRVRTFYTLGGMISNQIGSNGSSAAAEYLAIGLAFAPRLESPSGHRPGFNTSISGLFSEIPVAASAGSSGSGSGNSSGLNILSSQASARVQGTVSQPFRLSKPLLGGYSFFDAPVLKAGFDTLLNPAATATTGSSSAETTATAVFAPVYWQGSGGLRMGFRQYPADSNAASRTIAQVDITVGKFSNLQGYVCKPSVVSGTTTSTTSPTNTKCVLSAAPAGYAVSPSGTNYWFDQSRITLSRMEVEGFFQLPGSFVLGIDANLPESLRSPRNIDIQNKPGSNVTIYFGVTGTLTSLFKKMKIPGTSTQ